MFGRMGFTRIAAESSEESVRAFATKSERKISILFAHYRDEDLPGPDAIVTLRLDNLPAAARKAKVRHFRIDRDHSNSFEAWKRMGSPAKPSEAQYADLMRAAALAEIEPGKDPYSFQLPRQGVSLLELAW
jgi:xylan 1,4-beta-xylosidase